VRLEDALDLLAWNRVHKRGNWYIRSCVQYLAAVLSEKDHLLNDYMTHDFDHCKQCKEHSLVSWTKKQEAEQEEAERAAWVEAENERLEKLGQFEFREPTPEEQKAFIAMRGEEGWTVGKLKERTTPKMWSGVVTHPAAWPWQYASAAILWFLKLGQPVSWESFGILVEQIRELDKPTVSAS
jgi:hypothetical protein